MKILAQRAMAMRRLLVLGLIGLLLVPLGAGAQTGEVKFPPGVWDGTVMFGGTLQTDGTDGDGNKYSSTRQVTNGDITFVMIVDDEGQVGDGSMTINISWTDLATGTTPVTFDPYRVTHEHTQTGVLDLDGTAGALIASGTINWNVQTTDTHGNLVEEVSGDRPAELHWVFQASDISCGLVTGKLTEGTGPSLVASAALPRYIFDEPEISNELVALFRALPKYPDVDVEGIVEAAATLDQLASEALDGTPTPGELLGLVQALEALRLELARIEYCDLVPPGYLVQSTFDVWLATIMQNLLLRSLEMPADFTTQDLISLLGSGVRSGAIGASAVNPETAVGLYDGFSIALEFQLEQALAALDADTITDIAVAAGSYGYQDLYDQAMAALEEVLAEEAEEP